jgi:hypothetical protein
MRTITKLKIADDVTIIGKKVESTAVSWGVSQSDVRQFVTEYAQNQQKAYDEYVAREEAKTYPCQYIKTFEEYKARDLA